MTLDHTTEKLVGLASNLQFDDLPAGAVTAAKARILSTLGVSLAAFDLEPVRIARKLAQPVAAGPRLASSARSRTARRTCFPALSVSALEVQQYRAGRNR